MQVASAISRNFFIWTTTPPQPVLDGRQRELEVDCPKPQAFIPTGNSYDKIIVGPIAQHHADHTLVVACVPFHLFGKETECRVPCVTRERVKATVVAFDRGSGGPGNGRAGRAGLAP